jgi:hypothetical protein
MDRIRQTAKVLCCRRTPERPPASPVTSPATSPARGGSAQGVLPAATSREDARRLELEDQLSGEVPQAVRSTTGRADDVPAAGELLVDSPTLSRAGSDDRAAHLPGATGQGDVPLTVLTFRSPHNTGVSPLFSAAGSLHQDTHDSTLLSSTSTRFSLSSSSSNSNEMPSPFPGLPPIGVAAQATRKLPPVAPAGGRIGRPKNDLGENDSVSRSSGSVDASPRHQNAPSSESSELAWWNSSANMSGSTEEVSSDRLPAQSNRSLVPPAINRTYGGLLPRLAVAPAATTRQLPFLPLIGSEPGTAFVLQPRRERYDPPQVNLNAAATEAAAAAAVATAAASIPPASLPRHPSGEEFSSTSSSE